MLAVALHVMARLDAVERAVLDACAMDEMAVRIYDNGREHPGETAHRVATELERLPRWSTRIRALHQIANTWAAHQRAIRRIEGRYWVESVRYLIDEAEREAAEMRRLVALEAKAA